MDCPTEEALIRKRLGSVPGIGELSFNLMTRRLTVLHTLNDERPIQSTLREIGMNAVPALPAAQGSGSLHEGDNQTSANAIAAQVGIEDVRGNLLPEETGGD